MRSSGAPYVVLGAGPAGLTAGYLLASAGEPVVLVEAEDQVGGLAKTVIRDGYRFDLGGHRFYTKSREVEGLWHELMGSELLRRKRLSRIYWNGRFLDYPLRAGDVVRKLGPVELARCCASYARSVSRRRRAETFEDWVTKRFGRRLFELFFRSYTEKVWGVPTSEIRAEWAAQRIRGLSFTSAARAALGGKGEGLRTLVHEFDYPRLGPGQMWERLAERIEQLGGEIRLGAPVEALELGDGGVEQVVAGGESIPARAVVSSLPLRTAVAVARPKAPAAVRAAARGLRYRDFLTVALALEGDPPFPDTWIYVHEPSVRVARIQSYGAWSPWMLPRPGTACIGLEYFCFAGEPLWEAADEELIALATDEVARLRLADPARVSRGWVVRVPRAYPMYDAEYGARVRTIRRWLAASCANLEQVGRNGLHRYNNSDHSMLTAIRAVENLLRGTRHDVWTVNADGVYLEEGAVDEQPYRRVPETPAAASF
ncbi:MAG TPA: NAD(P)/FAD-dependent oxidoreductase [Gaiellaceae bacterium]|nr:NAD(P)/FAD-dependent oxidoreductase [Gaiellaceae bacterium]